MSNDLDPVVDASTESDIDESRRRLFGKGAAVAAVAAVAGLASSSKANAANNDPILIAASNESSTVATTTLGGGTTFRVNDGVSVGNASIYGTQGGSGGQIGVRGDSSVTSGIGVYGLVGGSGGAGVYGEFDGGGTASGTGVIGASDNGIGVRGNGTSFDLYAGSSGKLGLATATVTATTSGSIGTIARDSAGVLWYCYAANKWQRIGGAAGGFTPIAPVRVFDSRNAAFPTSGSFTAGSNRVISVKDGRDQSTGAVTTANAVPAGATAVTFNVTATNTVGGNFLAVVPGDVATTDVSTLNWTSTGVSIANASVSKLDGSRQLRIIGGGGGSFDCIVDITGYYL